MSGLRSEENSEETGECRLSKGGKVLGKIYDLMCM